MLTEKQQKKRDKKVAKYHKKGWSYRQIADKVGCSHTQVANILHKLAVEARQEEV